MEFSGVASPNLFWGACPPGYTYGMDPLLLKIRSSENEMFWLLG